MYSFDFIVVFVVFVYVDLGYCNLCLVYVFVVRLNVYKLSSNREREFRSCEKKMVSLFIIVDICLDCVCGEILFRIGSFINLLFVVLVNILFKNVVGFVEELNASARRAFFVCVSCVDFFSVLFVNV